MSQLKDSPNNEKCKSQKEKVREEKGYVFSPYYLWNNVLETYRTLTSR